MKIILEDYVPFDRSVQWRIHDAYYASRGIAAWKEGILPYFGTNNYPSVRADARLILEVARELIGAGRLGRKEKIFILEIGGGLGQFAHHFFKALREGCGELGQELEGRIRYVFSDYSRKNLGEAVRTPALQGLVRSGRLIPARFDLRRPKEIRDHQGRAMAPRFTAILANYVCCVSPMKLIRKTNGGYQEKYLRLGVRTKGKATARRLLQAYLEKPTQPRIIQNLVPSYEWRAVELEASLPGIHAQVLRALLQEAREATLTYPAVFLDAMRSLEARSLPGALFLINDCGTLLKQGFQGLKECAPSFYGNTLSCPVSFPVLEAFCRQAGWDVALSRDPSFAIHTAAVRFMPRAPDSFRKAFRRSDKERHKGEDITDLGSAGVEAFEKKNYLHAIRHFKRCLRLDPESPEVLYRLGEACVEAGLAEEAIAFLGKGKEFDAFRLHDFDYQLGRACHRLGRFQEALVSYENSLKRDDHSTTHANLGFVYLDLRELRNASRCFRKALALDPKNARARKALEAMRSVGDQAAASS